MVQQAPLEIIRKAWARIAGFAVCESEGSPDPSKRKARITIDYPNLEKAQDAYRAMIEITKALKASEDKP